MAWVNRLQGLLGGKHVACKIILTGLPNSGKSTLMIQLKPPESQMTHATLPMDYTAEEFTSIGLSVHAFDLGRDLSGFGNPWEDYYNDCDAIVFVLDGSDRYVMPHVTEVLEILVDKVEVRDIPILFLANKNDLPGAMSNLQLQEMLGLSKLLGKKSWTMFGTDALTGDGLNESLDWLAHKLRHKCRKDLRGPMLKC